MAYNKQQWKDEIPDLAKPIKDSSGKQKTDPQTGRPLYELVQEGTRITSARLNHIEDGIETVNELVDQNTADIDTHKKDAVKHITAAERAEWKAKETPAGAQTKADAALSAAKTYADTALLAKADKSSTYSKTETDQRIQAVVGAAPDALDTLKEIGDALNNDPNFAATVTNQLSGKVDKVAGKQLSTEDYSSAEKAKLAGLTPGAGAAGSATDTTIGNRTADPSITTPYSLTGTITQWFSWLTKYLKSITGKANPFDAPDITLAATKTHVDDTTRHITAVERTAWNVKETPTGAQAKADAAQAAAIATAATDATTKANSAQTAATNAANTALALKAPLASPALTGTPTAPTAAVGTNSTQLATTAFVQAEKASPSIPASTDLNVFRNEGDYYCASNATAATILNMPPAIAGQSFYLHNGTHAGVNQSIVSYNSASFRIYTRNFYSPNTPQWSDWMEIEHSGRKNVSGGYAGLDTNSKVARANTYNDLGGSSTIPTVDLDLALTAGVYPISPVTLNKPTASMWGQVLVFVSGAETHNNANTWTWQIILQSSGGSYVRYKDAAAAWSAWVPLWTGNNDAPLFMTRSQIANNTDFNTVTANGIYIIYQPTGTTNAPPVTYGVFSVSKAGVNYVEQRITEVTTGDVYSRVGNVGSSWTPWVVNITSAGGNSPGLCQESMELNR